ncbi:UvrD-helicase domain-containing protein [Lewinella sp. IMCC34183]|uniref:UvrD-helicase domain-containing protein n=1 Tax=Lewinella sp. IMCC34183 TaxID=2248762 RepID=UPI000E2693E8|nr:UvrD-helicase domain-containing protein [Lewinella sp. IMCC34183]
MLQNLKLISAGAGSGKTYRLTQEMTALLTEGSVRPAGIIATTFTKRAAAELKERVRVALLRKGLTREANELTSALIGTVHGLGVKLLRRFAYEAGVSPQVDIIADGDGQRLFNLSMAKVIKIEQIQAIENLCVRLSLSQGNDKYNWRGDVLNLVEIIRGNNFSAEDIARSRWKSWESLAAYLPPVNDDLSLEQFHTRLERLLKETRQQLLDNERDQTKKTDGVAQRLRDLLRQLKERDALPWAEYAKLARLEQDVGAKSRELVTELAELGARHASLRGFQDDLKGYQDLLFDFAAEAIREYDTFKKNRGRIDYTDMEVLVLDLLDNPNVQETLRRELDLLMVDEFQDTSPMQLAIFLRLSELARRSVWVGDPKQSIYGFRGAEPRLMAAVMQANGPIDPANIQRDSWRSRQELVYACNSLFVAAFPEFSPKEVSLEPIRCPAGTEHSPPESEELAATGALIHWHFEVESGRYNAEFLRDALAKAVRELLANPPLILPKGAKQERRLVAGDVAILCRSNQGCFDLADSLAKQGIPAAIARKGLMQTAEATFILACLKYMLNPSDTLSVAEILLFGARRSLPEIIDLRLAFLSATDVDEAWARDQDIIRTLDELRTVTSEHSTSEMLNIILERADVRRIAVAWGTGEQRLSNIDEIRRLAVAYEDHCHHQHTAASLGGFLLYLDGLVRDKDDQQGASERPEAVNVLTYHKSKGLEWPAVVCYDLDQNLRAGVWGRAVVPNDPDAPVDLERPLANRWLRYWVNPYGKLAKGVPLIETLAESSWQERATEEALAEEARLLYVGMTRARDYLILPTGKNGASWVDRVYARGGKATSVLEPGTSETPFSWNGMDIDKRYQQWTEPRQQPAYPMAFHEIPFIDRQRSGRQSFPPLRVTEEFLLSLANGTAPGQPLRYVDLPEPEPATDQRVLARCIAHFLAGDPVAGGDQDYRRELATGLLDDFAPGGDPEPDTLLHASDGFHSLRDSNWPDATFRCRVAVRGTVRGHRYGGHIDWLGEQPDGSLILLQDVCLSGKQFQQQSALRIAEVKLLAEVLHQSTSAPVTAAFLHFPGTGELAEVPL